MKHSSFHSPPMRESIVLKKVKSTPQQSYVDGPVLLLFRFYLCIPV